MYTLLLMHILFILVNYLKFIYLFISSRSIILNINKWYSICVINIIIKYKQIKLLYFILLKVRLRITCPSPFWVRIPSENLEYVRKLSSKLTERLWFYSGAGSCLKIVYEMHLGSSSTNDSWKVVIFKMSVLLKTRQNK